MAALIKLDNLYEIFFTLAALIKYFPSVCPQMYFKIDII